MSRLEKRIIDELVENPLKLGMIAFREGMTLTEMLYRMAHTVDEEFFSRIVNQFDLFDMWLSNQRGD